MGSHFGNITNLALGGIGSDERTMKECIRFALEKKRFFFKKKKKKKKKRRTKDIKRCIRKLRVILHTKFNLAQ